MNNILHFDYPRAKTNFNNSSCASTPCASYESAPGSFKNDLKEMDTEKLRVKEHLMKYRRVQWRKNAQERVCSGHFLLHLHLGNVEMKQSFTFFLKLA